MVREMASNKWSFEGSLGKDRERVKPLHDGSYWERVLTIFSGFPPLHELMVFFTYLENDRVGSSVLGTKKKDDEKGKVLRGTG